MLYPFIVLRLPRLRPSSWYLLVLCMLACLQAVALPAAIRVKPLNPGDIVPEVSLKMLRGDSMVPMPLTAFADKHVILDFFASWCGGCVEAMPGLQALQQQWGDRLQIIAVCYEPASKLQQMLQQRPAMGKGGILYAVGDSSLHDYFPHRLLPHEVWLEPGLKVAAITGATEITPAHVAAFIEGTLPSLPRKADILDFDKDKPLFADGNGGEAPAITFRSLLTGCIPGLGNMAGQSMDTILKTERHYYINQGAIRLYEQLYQPESLSRLQISAPARKILETKGSCLSYELTVPAGSPDSLVRQWMLRDLNAWLGVETRRAQAMISCLALVKNTASGKAIPADWIPLPLNELLYRLNHAPGKPVLNETGMEDPVLLVPDPIPAGTELLLPVLQANGYDLVAVTRELEIIQIR